MRRSGSRESDPRSAARYLTQLLGKLIDEYETHYGKLTRGQALDNHGVCAAAPALPSHCSK